MIAFAVLAGYVIYIAARGTIGEYMSVLGL